MVDDVQRVLGTLASRRRSSVASVGSPMSPHRRRRSVKVDEGRAATAVPGSSPPAKPLATVDTALSTAPPTKTKPDRCRIAVAVCFLEQLLARFPRYGPLMHRLTSVLREAVYVHPSRHTELSSSTPQTGNGHHALAKAIFGWAEAEKEALLVRFQGAGECAHDVQPPPLTPYILPQVTTNENAAPADTTDSPTRARPDESPSGASSVPRSPLAALHHSPTGRRLLSPAKDRAPSAMSTSSYASEVFKSAGVEDPTSEYEHPGVRALARQRTHFEEVKLLRRQCKTLRSNTCVGRNVVSRQSHGGLFHVVCPLYRLSAGTRWS